MAARTETEIFEGEAGRIDCALDWPDGEVKGWALVLHPHPLHGGARGNKVVTTIARAANQRGLLAVRPDFRGVGQSEGSFDHARGETRDMIALVEQFRTRYPDAAAGAWALGGFSFGTAVAAHVYDAYARQERAPDALLLAGPAVARFPLEGQEEARRVPLDRTLLVHGEVDDVVPLAEVFDWLRADGVPVTVVPGAGHFFHGHLITLRGLAEAHIARLCG
ncbi:alpha/beta hydrolase [Kerstersia gyiorum]|uniref:Alpha/beta hydrolase n=1 Tax=Kerstersia gyiorum TaxID=206506 RepID=A0A171KWT2_9BURK|nr:alpha/beta hydrolase [Kerstersia gyiorum]MCO7635931.1 alpha/beta hydrolase [Pseudomonas sp. S 311-6]KAB0544834.1 alpha/beta hydrolase [Kerstersia gyiorum]KKO73349.1 alpha/beta hydrolase [Kerstersia gyiorum]MCP1632074.1 alpha/beta superfamily hydrolase [Kerstersia gyiorum]MCP1635418.1 alpha/beta superfamily hydrolase [Kerstersia gyiorum]